MKTIHQLNHLNSWGPQNVVGGSTWWVLTLVCSVSQQLYKPGLLNEQTRDTKNIGFTGIVYQGRTFSCSKTCAIQMYCESSKPGESLSSRYPSYNHWNHPSLLLHPLSTSKITTVNHHHESLSMIVNPDSSAWISSDSSAWLAVVMNHQYQLSTLSVIINKQSITIQ